MRFEIFHETVHEYSQPAFERVSELRLTPLSDATQRALSSAIDTTPHRPLLAYTDAFGNTVHWFNALEPHRRLVIRARSTVDTLLENPFNFSRPVADYRHDAQFNPGEWYDCLAESRYIAFSRRLKALARKIVWRHKGDFLSFLQEINATVFREFEYVPGITTVHSHLDEALSHRKGVCQDFTHAMIGVCRVLSIPARYVSGYVFGGGEGPSMRGLDASHGWCEVYLPGVGWRGFDPTNNVLANDCYVKLAVGRDYADISPVRGVHKAGGTETLAVRVIVKKLRGR